MSSPQCFEESLRWVLEREGVRWDAKGTLINTGLNDRPEDPGGLTKFGIAQRYHPDVDVRNLTLAGATEIYRREYWDAFKCDTFSDPWALFVFDSAVQHSPARVVDFEKENSVCAAIADRAAYYQTLPHFPTDGAGWLRRLALLRVRLLGVYGVDCT